MKQKMYELLKLYADQVNALDIVDKYNKYHRIYKKLFLELKQKKYNNIGFIQKNADDMDYFAIIDSLLENNKNIFCSSLENKNLVFKKIESVYSSFEYYSGQRVYQNLATVNPNLIKVLIIPVQIYKEKKVVLIDKTISKFVKNFKGLKIAIAFEFAKTIADLNDLDYVMVDDVIVA